MDLWDLTDFSLHSNYRLLGPDWDADTPLKNGARNCGLDLRGPRTAPGEEALLLPDAGASVVSMTKETIAEFRQDIILGVGFLVLALVALRRIRGNVNQSGSETVITTFYSLIFATSVLRAVWFLIPSSILKQGYVPEDVHAFDDHWVGAFVSEILLSIGSLTLFSVFILIVIYWADLLKKIFKDSVRPSHPMTTFLTVAGFLMAAEGINSCLFLADVYSSEGMILFNSVEISRFSQRFRTVLQTLGAINQVSTEAQVRRIIHITVTGNVFFVLFAACEITIGCSLFMFYRENKNFDLVFDPKWWDWYILIKHLSEWLILSLMLWILHSPSDGGGGSRVVGEEWGPGREEDYREVSINGGEDFSFDEP